MPYEMKNCVLWHVPKTGGTWAQDLCTKNRLILNRPYNIKGHITPDVLPELLMKPGIVFVREPLSWYKSMFIFGIAKKAKGQIWFDRWFGEDFWEKDIILKPTEKEYDYQSNYVKFIEWVLAEHPHYYTELLSSFQVSRFIICKTENLTEEFAKILPLFEDISSEKIKSYPPRNISEEIDLHLSDDLMHQIWESEKDYLNQNARKAKLSLPQEDVFDYVERRLGERTGSKTIVDELNLQNIMPPNGEFKWTKANLSNFYDNKIFKTDKSKVSVIISGRNYGRFLADCIHSAMNQTLRPLEIIYSDDGSTDNSLQVAKKFLNVKIVTQEHIGNKNGVARARNGGAKIAKGKYLLFVDVDDMLGKPYIENNVSHFHNNPKAVGVYNEAHAFQNMVNFWGVPEWNESQLWHRNFCNTTTMYKASVFKAIGGWKEELNTGWDWNLAARMAREGEMIKGGGALFYRFHKNNWSNTNKKSLKYSQKTVSMTRQTMAKTNICCVLSDRVIGGFDKWLDAISKSVDHYNEVSYSDEFPFPVKPSLTIMYTGKDRTQIPNIHNESFSDIKFMYSPFELELGLSEKDRRDAVSGFLANAYNNLMSDSNADVFWFVEDDIIVPTNAFHRLYDSLLGEEHIKMATCGVYSARHDGHLLAYIWENEGQVFDPVLPKPIDFPEEDRYIGCTGTGCLMIFRHKTRHHFGSHHIGVPAHDWNFSWQCTAAHDGWPAIYLCADVHCKHMIDDKTYVDAQGLTRQEIQKP
jgi:glycosyltransferase involved in cell wall biosynthesis